MGQVLFLVAVAIAFAAAGTFIGRELTPGASLGCFFAGFGMLLVSSFGGNRFPIFRVGGFAIGWLYAIALLIGLGMGPAVAYVATVEPSALTQAAGGTALTVLGMGALGFALSKDLAPWMRPLSIAILGLVVVDRDDPVLRGRQPDHLAGHLRRLRPPDHGRLQLPAQARHRGPRGDPGDGHLRVDREHLPVAHEPLLRAVGAWCPAGSRRVAGQRAPVAAGGDRTDRAPVPRTTRLRAKRRTHARDGRVGDELHGQRALIATRAHHSDARDVMHL
jgi:hypothetical protein